LAGDPEDANLARVLAFFARWRRCSVCGEIVLYVDQRCTTEGNFACGTCYHRASVWAANDNGEAP